MEEGNSSNCMQSMRHMGKHMRGEPVKGASEVDVGIKAARPAIASATGWRDSRCNSTDCCDKTDKGLYSVLSELWSKVMRYSSQVKPISYLKANAAEVLTRLAEQREPLVITQNGEAKAVLQDVASYEETQETLALLKILALGQQDVEAGRVKPVADVVARLRAKRAMT